MTTMSGVVAILNPEKDAVIRVRDLGETPIEVKAEFVRPFELSEPVPPGDDYSIVSYDIQADKVIGVINLVTAADRVKRQHTEDLKRVHGDDAHVIESLAAMVLELLDALSANNVLPPADIAVINGLMHGRAQAALTLRKQKRSQI